MTKRIVVCSILLASPSLLLAQAFRPAYNPARVIVKFRAGSRLLVEAHAAARSGRASYAARPLVEGGFLASRLAASRVVALAALKRDASLEPLAAGVERIFVGELEPGMPVSDAIRALGALDDVEYAEPDFAAHGDGIAVESDPSWTRVGLLPNDPLFSGQWSLRNTGQTVNGFTGKAGADINATPAWDITTGSSSVTLALLDTGIATSAADFSGRLVEGFDFVNNKTDASDDHGHGTAVASIAAANGNNSVAMAGINWQCKILPVKVLDANNAGDSSKVASGLIFAADKGAKVINVSVSIAEDVAALKDAVDYAVSKGAILVAGMGNGNSEAPSYPAAYASVIAVGATDNQDRRAALFCRVTGFGGSNFGNHIDFVAPGDLIRGMDRTNPTTTLLFCGTSFATSMVSGVVSLLLAVSPSLTGQQVYDALKAGAQDQVGLASEDTAGWDKFHGWGRIDVYKSLLATGGTTALTSTLYFPRLVTSAATSSSSDNSENTGIAVANLGTTDATFVVRAFERSGAALSGTDIVNPKVLQLKAGEQIPVIDSQVFGAGLPAKKPIGWFKLESTSTKTVGFFLMFNDKLTVLDGADVSGGTMTSFVLPEIEDLGFTQVHVVNPSASTANLTFELLKSDGTARAAAVTRAVAANGAVAETLSQLFPGAGTPVASDYMRVASDRGVTAFEFLGKAGEYVEGLNGQNAALGATVLYSPQYVVSRDFRSTLSIVNLDSVAGSVTLELVGDDGVALAPALSRQIAARGKIYISDQSFFVLAGSGTTQGYVKVTSSGPKLAGSVVFGDPARNTFSSSLPLVSTLLTSFVYSQLASNETYFTGVAILNPNDSAATVTIEVYDAKGVRIVSTVESIPARGRKSQLLTQFFSTLIGQNRSSGYIKVTSDKTVASFALFGTNDLSVLSAVPPQVVP